MSTSPLIKRPATATIEENDWAILSQHWFPVAVAGEVLDAPVSAKLLDVDLVLFRTEAGVTVARDLCPHRGVLLSKGWVSGGLLICPYHGLHFNAEGRCMAVPSDPNANIPDRLALTVLPSVERFGLIWTSFTPGEPTLPAFEAWDEAGFQQIVCPVIDIAGAAGRQIEGFIDVAHFAWAHTATFGDRSNPVVPDYAIEKTPGGVQATYLSSVSNYGPDMRHMAPDDFLWRRTFNVYAPFCARLVVDFPEGKQLWILNAASPMSARETRLFCPIARNVDTDVPVEDVRAFNLKVFNEDRALVESQKPEDLPLDLGLEVHIAADRTSVAYRRVLKGMGLSLVYVG